MAVVLNRRKHWDGKERRSRYEGEERRSGKDRRAKFDQNTYGTLSILDQVERVGVFRVNPQIFAEKNGFSEPAWIYDRRNKRYQEWRENSIRPHIRIRPEDEEKTRGLFHTWDSRDLLEGMYVG